MGPDVSEVGLAGARLGDVGQVDAADRTREVDIHVDVLLVVLQDALHLGLEMRHEGGGRVGLVATTWAKKKIEKSLKMH